mgnify:CR=1 FL=1
MSNLSTLKRVLKNPKKVYRGPAGPKLAATMIQKNYKMFKDYQNYKQLQYLIKMATVIQRKYRLWQIKNTTRKKLKKLEEDSYKAWTKM